MNEGAGKRGSCEILVHKFIQWKLRPMSSMGDTVRICLKMPILKARSWPQRGDIYLSLAQDEVIQYFPSR